MKELGFLKNKCTMCAACVDTCSNGCHVVEDGRHVIDRSKCLLCGKCVSACLYDALLLYGRRMSSEEVLNAVLEDSIFYRYSGGGVTLSGGEPLLQADFCAELFGRIKEHGIHRALDTGGHVPWRNFEKVLPFTDLVLYDIKHIDPVEHEKWTGVSNALILENLARLSGRGIPVEIVIPVVPGANTTDSCMKGIGGFISALEIPVPVKLLPYHSFAHSKYSSTGHIDTLPDAAMPEAVYMRHVGDVLMRAGVRNVSIPSCPRAGSRLTGSA